MIVPILVLKTFSFFNPHELDNAMLVLVLFTFFVGSIGISFSQEPIDLDILLKLLIPSIDLLHQNSKNSLDWYEFFTNVTFSVSIVFFGIFIAPFFYKLVFLSLQNLNLFNLFQKSVPIKMIANKIINVINDRSYNRGYIDVFFEVSLIASVRKVAKFNYFFDRQVIDGILNGIGISSFFYRRGYQTWVGRTNFFVYFLFFINLFSNLLLYIYIIKLDNLLFNLNSDYPLSIKALGRSRKLQYQLQQVYILDSFLFFLFVLKNSIRNHFVFFYLDLLHSWVNDGN